MEKMDMIFYRKLPTPLEVKQQYPIGEEIEKLKAERDEIIKNVISVTEKFIKDNLDAKTIKVLKGAFRPASVMDVFKLSKNYKATFDNYMADFKSVICNEETNFIKAINTSKKFDELLTSPEYQIYKNTL